MTRSVRTGGACRVQAEEVSASSGSWELRLKGLRQQFGSYHVPYNLEVCFQRCLFSGGLLKIWITRPPPPPTLYDRASVLGPLSVLGDSSVARFGEQGPKPQGEGEKDRRPSLEPRGGCP